MAQTKEMQSNWTRLKKSNIYFYVFFDSYCERLISGRKTGH